MKSDISAKCAGKKGFDTPQMAAKVARNSKIPAQHYRCPHCGKFHVGGSERRHHTQIAAGWKRK